jgi:hypothetical protein
MDKQSLFNLLLDTMHRADLSQFLEFSAAHPELTSQFNLSELVKLDDSLNKCLDKPTNSEWVKYLVDTHLYKKSHLPTFFNEISLATVNVPGEVRIMVPDGMQRHTKGMPDCIAITTETGAMQGLEFKHFKTPRLVLQDFPCKKYDILTPTEFKAHYHANPFVNKVYSYEEIQKRMPGYSRHYFDQQAMYSMKMKNKVFSDFRLNMKWFGLSKF